MSILTQKDGELRLYDGSTSKQYLQILFTQGDITFPLGRNKVEEMLNMDRGNFDSNASYHEGPDDPILEPLPYTLSCLVDDQAYTGVLEAIFSGVTTVGKVSATDPVTLTTTKATSTLVIQNTDVSTVAFADPSKIALDAEILFDTSGTDIGWQHKEVYFTPGEQTIAEGTDGTVLNINGMWYGSSTTISAFTSGAAI